MKNSSFFLRAFAGCGLHPSAVQCGAPRTWQKFAYANRVLREVLPFIFLAFFLCGFRPEAEEPRVFVPANVRGESTFREGDDFSIAAWNIEWFPGKRPRDFSPEAAEAQIRGVSEWVREQDPTILVACEVRDLASLKKLQLENHLSLACAEFRDRHPGLPNLGIAIVSRIPWKEIWALDFSNLARTRDRPPRGILGARFILPNGEALTIYGLHLKSNYGDNESTRLQRQRAVRYLEWDWRRRGLDPLRDNIVLGGDFNTSPHDPAFEGERTLSVLTQKYCFSFALEGAVLEEQLTLPAGPLYGGKKLDHILFSQPLREKLTRAPPWGRVIVTPVELSDHFPLFLPAPEWGE